MSAPQPVIQMESVKKIFFTEEVETHALAGIHMQIDRGRVCCDLRAVGMREIDVAVDPGTPRLANRGRLLVELTAGFRPVHVGARPNP